jgi:surfeit locus 1 family protein
VTAAAPRPGLVVPGLLALVAFIAFIGLGSWQIDRKAWKEALIDTLDRRLSAEPVALPPPERWPVLDPAEDEYRRVVISAEFVPGAEALVYTSGSTLRTDVSGPGYWVFAPARLGNGRTVVINRGFVPEGQQDAGSHAAPPESIAMTGALRWPEPRGWFVPKDDRNLFFVRDQLAIAAAKGWGEVAPFFVELESPQPLGGLPRAGRLSVNLRNEHLQYAITWYGLAAVLAIAFAFWVRSRLREARAPAN